MKKQILFLLVALPVLLAQCSKPTPQLTSSDVPNLSGQDYDYSVQLPATLPNNTPSNNPITNPGANLGRVLFYDKKLSINNVNSCGSCHNQFNGFAENKMSSVGFEGGLTSRNSMSIINTSNQGGYFWDGRTESLEEMVLQPVRHQLEMGMEKMDVLTKKLSVTSYYPDLFEKAFGSPEITKEKIGLAMAQFLRSMSHYNSKADRAKVAESWGSSMNGVLNTQEQRGAQLFFGHAGCASCHSGVNFRGMDEKTEANIGLDMEYADNGIGLLKGSKFNGVFRVPSLRNVALTAPYMHDGRFKTLQEVVQHYNKGIVKHENLSPILRNNSWGGGDDNPRRLNLTNNQVEDLVVFLKTLTDEGFVNDPKFADPFTNK